MNTKLEQKRSEILNHLEQEVKRISELIEARKLTKDNDEASNDEARILKSYLEKLIFEAYIVKNGACPKDDVNFVFGGYRQFICRSTTLHYGYNISVDGIYYKVLANRGAKIRE